VLRVSVATLADLILLTDAGRLVMLSVATFFYTLAEGIIVIIEHVVGKNNL